jgi:hypothetical protein
MNRQERRAAIAGGNLVRQQRVAEWYKVCVLRPRDTRLSVWIHSLNEGELYTYYWRMAVGHARTAQKFKDGGVHPGWTRKDAIYHAKKYFGYCAMLREGEIPCWETVDGTKIRFS